MMHAAEEGQLAQEHTRKAKHHLLYIQPIIQAGAIHTLYLVVSTGIW